jgi:hypothetical protein
MTCYIIYDESFYIFLTFLSISLPSYLKIKRKHREIDLILIIVGILPFFVWPFS